MRSSPLAVPWKAAFWASDPNWTNPGDGNTVSSWRDASGNGNTATQATGSKQPVFHAADLGTKPCVTFDGVDDFLQTAAFTALSQPATIYAVSQYLTFSGAATQLWFDGIASGNRWSAGYNSGGKFTMFGGGSPAQVGTFDVIAHAINGQFAAGTGADQLYISGTAQGSPFPVDTGSGTLTGITLGGRFDGAASFANLRLCFAGVLDRQLTASEQISLDTWAQDYYGIAVSDYQIAGRLARSRRFKRV